MQSGGIYAIPLGRYLLAKITTDDGLSDGVNVEQQQLQKEANVA